MPITNNLSNRCRSPLFRLKSNSFLSVQNASDISDPVSSSILHMKNRTGLSLGEVVYSFISFLDFIYSLNSFDSIFGTTLKTSFMPAIRSTKLSVQESIRAIQINFSLSIVFLTDFGLISIFFDPAVAKKIRTKTRNI